MITRLLGAALVLGVILGTIGEVQSAYLYYGEFDGARIVRANLDGTGRITLVSGSRPAGPTLDLARGQMYWGEVGGANIWRANLDGTGQTILVSGRSGPGAPALDLGAGRMYWHEVSGGEIRCANLDGSDQRVLVSGQNSPRSVVLDLVGGKMYWSEWGAGNIRRANLDGTGLQLVVSGLSNPNAIALDLAGGRMFWCNQGSGRISRANLDGSNQEIFVQNLSSPIGIALDLNSGHMYWANSSDIRRANLDGTEQQVLITGLSRPGIVTLDLISDGPPAILFSPPNQSALIGGTVTLAVGAAGLKPLFYRWHLNDAPLINATNTTLTVSNLTLNDSGNYRVLVTNSLGSVTSQTVTLSVLPLLITSQTSTTNVWPGSNVTFRVAITSAVPVSCQWRFNGTDIPNATNLTFAIANVQTSHEGEYSAALINGFGSVTSAPARLSTLVRPVILQSPLSQSVVAGGSATFSLSISGNPPPFGYQWRRGSTVLTNLTLNVHTCFFTVANVQTNQGGTYRVVITNAASPTLAVNASFELTVLADADSDGLPDDWEKVHGLNATDSADAMFDADGDARSNLQEYLAGTDPINALSDLRIDSVALVNGATEVALRFQAVSNRTYTVQSREAVERGLWNRVADIVATPTNRIVEISDPAAMPFSGQKFYRVVTPRIP